jgi:flagellin-like protein
MKGISSFIATILIIAFTVAIAGVISGWLLPFVTTETSTVQTKSSLEIICNDGAISLSDLKYNCPTLSGRVKNSGKVDLGKITLQVMYTNATQETQCISYAAGTLVNGTCPGNLTIAIGEEYVFNLTISGSNYDKIRVYANCTGKVSYEAKNSDVTTTC